MERAVAASNVRVQLLVHELPAANATVPPPEPANVTLTSQVLMKLVLAVASEFSVNEQEAPVQALLKASKREPAAAAGVSVTAVPSGSSTEQVPNMDVPLAKGDIQPGLRIERKGATAGGNHGRPRPPQENRLHRDQRARASPTAGRAGRFGTSIHQNRGPSVPAN